MKKLLKVTTNKKEFIISTIFALINIFIIVFFLYYSIDRAIDPAGNSSFLYPYGYGKYARNFSIILGILLVLSIIFFFFLLRKKTINIIISIYITTPILLFTLFGFFTISIKETRSIASYTQNINHYEKYDDLISNDLESIKEFLPNKNKVNKYEYFFHKQSSIWGTSYIFSMFIETDYEESVYLSIKEDETWNLKTDLDDPLLNNFECYQYTTYDLDIIRNIYILVNKINNKMIYAAESSRINIFSKYNNSYYIGAFINGDRTNPYFLYKE